ncbi:MAG: D-aminoacylase [Gammaproteobacteria bacterium]|nr:D-aminoacylase [Gammaproteobacteria bacterium]MDE0257222.1 D-aminoacylase [Gammaproteobacteria bacterium]
MQAGKLNAAFLVTLALLPSACQRQDGASGAYDILITNGRIVDGTGSPAFEGDVGIRGQRIAAVGDLSDAEAGRVIDATGHVVAPGFIDLHSHSSWYFLVDPRTPSKVTQGITLDIEGEGRSVAPIDDRYVAERAASYERFGIEPDWRTLGEFFDRLDANPAAINFASFVGTANIRELAVGLDDRPATPEELLEMERLTAEAMEDGALGVFSALMYTPDRFNTTEELVLMAQVAGRYGGVYQTHQRSEGDALFESLDEVFHIARESGIRTNVTHLKAAYVANWGRMAEVVDRINRAREEGLDIAADIYPYVWGAAGLRALLPPWAREGGVADIERRMGDSAIRDSIKRELDVPTAEWENEYLGAGGAVNFRIVDVQGNENYLRYEGMMLDEIAADLGKDPKDGIMDMIQEGGAGFVSLLTDENDLRLAMRQPWVAFGTDGRLAAPDGPLAAGLPHPRAYGTYARILGRYVRELGVISLEEAIRKSTSLAAENIGVEDRGTLAEGLYADVVVFDPETIMDHATYQDPHQYSTGVEYVVVNGEVVLDEGEITDARPGVVVRGWGYRGGG